MNEPFDITTIIFAVLAVFVVWKLRSVLGTRTGNERPPYDPFAARRKLRNGSAPAASGETGTVIRLPGTDEHSADATRPEAAPATDRWASVATPGSRASEGLNAIAAADPAFDAAAFLAGARAAYEMIVTAFAKGDRSTLVPLLAKDVLDGFSSAIEAREAQGRTVETTFVGVDKTTIEDAILRDRTAQIAIRFDTKLITVTRDAQGTVVEGSPDQVSDVSDLWTFARTVGTQDPNWKLVATESGA